MAIATLTGILFGLAPALRSTRIDVAPALKESAVSPPGTALIGRRFGVGNVLVVAQVALSILVLVGASLLARTLINLATMNVGFDAHNVVTLQRGARVEWLQRRAAGESLPRIAAAS